MQLYNFKIPRELLSLVRVAAAVMGARSVSAYVRGVLREKSLELLRDRAPERIRGRGRPKTRRRRKLTEPTMEHKKGD